MMNSNSSLKKVVSTLYQKKYLSEKSVSPKEVLSHPHFIVGVQLDSFGRFIDLTDVLDLLNFDWVNLEDHLEFFETPKPQLFFGYPRNSQLSLILEFTNDEKPSLRTFVPVTTRVMLKCLKKMKQRYFEIYDVKGPKTSSEEP